MNEEQPIGGAMPPDGQDDVAGVKCVHIYAMPDGTMLVSKTEGEPAPEDAQPAASEEEAFELARSLLAGDGAEAPEDGVMRGYNARKQPDMASGGVAPGAVFGEG
jgi:hypothetical protein